MIHEAVDEVSLKKLAPSQRLFEAIVGHHTTPEQAVDIFRRVSPRSMHRDHVDPERSTETRQAAIRRIFRSGKLPMT